MMIEKNRERDPIHVTVSMIERAYKKVQEFQRLVEKGKTPPQIFEDILKLIFVEE